MDINTNVSLQNLNSENLKKVDASKLEDKAIRAVSNDFESFFTQQLLDISLKETKVAGEGVGADIFQGMYTDAISRSSAGSFGISDMLYEFLSKENKKGNNDDKQ